MQCQTTSQDCRTGACWRTGPLPTLHVQLERCHVPFMLCLCSILRLCMCSRCSTVNCTAAPKVYPSCHPLITVALLAPQGTASGGGPAAIRYSSLQISMSQRTG